MPGRIGLPFGILKLVEAGEHRSISARLSATSATPGSMRRRCCRNSRQLASHTTLCAITDGSEISELLRNGTETLDISTSSRRLRRPHADPSQIRAMHDQAGAIGRDVGRHLAAHHAARFVVQITTTIGAPPRAYRPQARLPLPRLRPPQNQTFRSRASITCSARNGDFRLRWFA
jgi:hypothetical protein